jgi:hypothetical protein
MPALRALLKPIAIACSLLFAPCTPCLTCSISSCTNAPAAVEGAYPSLSLRWAMCLASLSVIGCSPPLLLLPRLFDEPPRRERDFERDRLLAPSRPKISSLLAPPPRVSRSRPSCTRADTSSSVSLDRDLPRDLDRDVDLLLGIIKIYFQLGYGICRYGGKTASGPAPEQAGRSRCIAKLRNRASHNAG